MRAAEYFQMGYSCSESLVKWAIDEGLVSEDLLPVATPFSGGMGVGCLCGAVAGAQIIIGSIWGKNNKHGNDAFARTKAKALVQRFMEKNGATCCRVLTRGFDMASPERKAHCVNMVDDCENIVKDLLKSENIGILK